MSRSWSATFADEVTMDTLNPYLLAFIPLFVTIDPLGLLPMFLALTGNIDDVHRRRVSNQAVAVAAVVGVAFMLVGKAVFMYLGISVADFQVAGGALLFVLSLADLLQPARRAQAELQHVAIVPIAMPIIVGPAVLTMSIMLIDTQGLAPTLASFLINLFLAWLVMAHSRYLVRLLGEGTLQAASKVFAILLAAIGIMMIRSGVIAICQAALRSPGG